MQQRLPLYVVCKIVNFLSMIVKQVGIALDLLEAFASEGEPMTLTAIAAVLRQPKSSCFNLVETLRSRGYLYEVRQRGGFYPTRLLSEMAEQIEAGDPSAIVLHEILATLASGTGETALLATRDRDQITYIDVVESPLPVRYFAKIGDRRPVYATSGGKAILSTYGHADLDREIAAIAFADLRENTIRNGDALRADIEGGERTGWFTNKSEYTPDVTGIGLPLVIRERRLGLSVAGPNYRMDGRHREIAEVVRECVDEAVKRLGLSQ